MLDAFDLLAAVLPTSAELVAAHRIEIKIRSDVNTGGIIFWGLDQPRGDLCG